jgi:hypothetical protein
MKFNSESPSSGMIWMEILVTLAVAAFISLVGLRALHGFMEQLAASRLQQIQLIELAGLEASLQRAWDQRCSHPFQEDSWLDVEGLREGESIDLSEFRMRTHSDADQVILWKLLREGTDWVLTETAVNGPSASDRRRLLQYSGSIQIELAASSWGPGREPATITWHFPGVNDQQLKDGFAIHSLW